MSKVQLSKKYMAFLACGAPVEFLEGTTAAGKTTVGLIKFILKVLESDKTTHILSGLDIGTVEKNVIGKELGILDDFDGVARYYPGRHGDIRVPHLVLQSPRGKKIIYVLGYDNKARWKKALGGQYGCVYIDEINIADIDYVREVAMRCDYLLATLNPDDPALPVYHEYINHSRPLPEWAGATPPELMAQLESRPAKPGWVHWFFTFSDNAGLDKDKLAAILASVPPGTKIYKNKVLGLRGRASGLVFNCKAETRITLPQAESRRYRLFTCGVDTAYSRRSDDLIAFIFAGVSETRELVILEEFVRNNRDLAEPITPSDLPVLLVRFLERCRKKWGLAQDIFIDAADAGSITECQKYRRRNGGLYNFLPAWKRTDLVSRIELQQGWLAHQKYLVAEHCTAHLAELNAYAWQEGKGKPEDARDHTINAAQYAWLPFVGEIG